VSYGIIALENPNIYNKLCMNELTPNINIGASMDEYLAKKRQEVDRAFESRPYKTYVPDKEQWLEDIQRVERDTRQLLEPGVEHADTMIKADQEIKPGEVTVEHSHLYRELLNMAVDKIAFPGQLTTEQKDVYIKRILKHEYEHYIRTFGIEGVAVEFGVSIAIDKNTGNTGLTPFVKVRGKLPLEAYQQIASAPEEMSSLDKITHERMNPSLKTSK